MNESSDSVWSNHSNLNKLSKGGEKRKKSKENSFKGTKDGKMTLKTFKNAGTVKKGSYRPG